MLKRVQHDNGGGEIPKRVRNDKGGARFRNEFGMTRSIEMLTRAKRTGEANEFSMTKGWRVWNEINRAPERGKFKVGIRVLNVF